MVNYKLRIGLTIGLKASPPMTQQTRHKILDWHTALKPYYSLIAIVLSTATLSWQITHAAFSVIANDTKELHANTAAIIQQRRDLSDLKISTAKSFDEIKCDNKLRDNKIQQNTLDIIRMDPFGKRLLTEK